MSPIAPFPILFLSTGQPAGVGEYLMRKFGRGSFESISVGSTPRAQASLEKLARQS